MLKTVLYVLAAIIIVGFVAKWVIQMNLEKKMATLTISYVDLSKIPDGTYTGNYAIFPVVVEASVTVKNHQIVQIRLLKHQNGQGGAAEALTGKIVEAQTLQVDVVSGATISSKVILKAVEVALSGASK